MDLQDLEECHYCCEYDDLHPDLFEGALREVVVKVHRDNILEDKFCD